jgi:cohesin complex subunit SA-1/2
VAEEWLARYKTNAVAATADLVNCILQCAGCDQLITEDDVLDLDNVAGRLADLQSIYQEVIQHSIVPLAMEILLT